MTKQAPLSPALRQLRASAINRYGENKITESGIWLCIRFRTEDSARRYAELVEQAKGTVDQCRKIGRQGRDASALTWSVVFTVGIAEDQYIAGRVDAAGLRELLATEAEALAGGLSPQHLRDLS